MRSVLTALFVVCVVGCGPKGPVMAPVSGTVKYSDGSIPTGEVRTIRFEPASFATGKPDPSTKAAASDIQPDGSFTLSTIDANDGARPGEYKVTFTIRPSYTGTDSSVDRKFEQAATTPLNSTVKQGEKNHFDFVIEKGK